MEEAQIIQAKKIQAEQLANTQGTLRGLEQQQQGMS